MWVDWKFHDSKILKMLKINKEYTQKPNWLDLDGDTYIYIGNYLLQDKKQRVKWSVEIYHHMYRHRLAAIIVTSWHYCGHVCHRVQVVI